MVEDCGEAAAGTGRGRASGELPQPVSEAQMAVGGS